MSSDKAARRKPILARNEEILGVLKQVWPIRWVMMRTSHPGNVGSAARALKTMGFHDLHLVNPAYQHMAKKAEAISLSSGAFDVLEGAQNHPSLIEAVGNSQLVFGLTTRDREFGPPAIPLSQAIQMAATAATQKITVSFRLNTGFCGFFLP